LAETTSRPLIALLVGLPGSGKSTWAQSKSPSGVLSSDALRELLSDNPDNQSIHTRVFRVLRDLLKHRLELRRPITYVDATNLTPYERRPYVKLADLFDAEIEAVFFDVPVDECIRRNRARGRIVPDEVIQKMAERLVAPDVKEGFSRVSRPGVLQE
jgi:predicted kinase